VASDARLASRAHVFAGLKSRSIYLGPLWTLRIMLRASASTVRARSSRGALSRAQSTSAWTPGTRPKPESFRAVAGLASAAALVAGGALLYTAPVVHNDAPNFVGNVKDAVRSAEEQVTGLDTKERQVDWLRVSVDTANESLVSLFWGSNK
jgi:hypothetical protein